MVAAEAPKNGRQSLILRTQYQERAAALVAEALKQMPEGQRAGFVRDVIEADPSLRVIRRRIRSQELSSTAGSKNDAAVSAPAP